MSDLLIDSYLDHLRVERRLAAHTLESYARDLRGLSRFAVSRKTTVEALDREMREVSLDEGDRHVENFKSGNVEK